MTGPRPRQVWIDGRLEPAEAAHLSAFDRGFQLGDGVFETMRARGGRVHELPAHLERLARSAAGLAIELPPQAPATIADAIPRLLAAEKLDGPTGDASIRITVSRGTLFERGLLPVASVPPTVVIQAWPIVPIPTARLERGLHLVTSEIRRDPDNPLNALKTTSRVEYVYARLEAQRAGADDVLFLTLDGHLSEATTANLFLVRGTELATPGLDCAILAGTTRDWVLGWARRAGLRAREAKLTQAELAAADEAFLSSSVAGIMPVTRFEDRPIGDGRPGPRTVRARAEREAVIAQAPP